MAYCVKVYNVFIAMPTGMDDIRKIIRNIVHKWNYINSESQKIVFIPTGWDSHTHPNQYELAQDQINRELEKADILIGGFRNRFGSPINGYESGTQNEIELHNNKSPELTCIYFLSDFDEAEITDEDDILQLKKVKDYKNSLIGKYETAISIEDFATKWNDDFQRLIIANSNYFLPHKTFDLINTRLDGNEEINDDSILLLSEAVNSNGILEYIVFAKPRTWVMVNKNAFPENENLSPKEMMRWKQALEDLHFNEMIELTDSNKYQVTFKGYQFIDAIQ